jgi:hypothetical protein
LDHLTPKGQQGEERRDGIGGEEKETGGPREGTDAPGPRTEHACGSHVTDGSVLSTALQYRGRACFVMSVQPAALV